MLPAVRLFAPALLYALCGLAGCRKAAEPAVAPPYGSAAGSFSPNFALARVTATAPGGTPIATPLEASGTYAFTRLPPGPYTLAFEPTGAYLTPPPQSVVVADKAHTQAAHVTLVRNTATRLSGLRWRLSAFTTTPAGGPARDEYAALPACARDDFFVLRLDGRGEWDEGAAKCQAAVPQTAPLAWQLRAEDTELWLDPLGSGPNPYLIEQLTPTTLTVRYYPLPTSQTTYRKTFTAF